MHEYSRVNTLHSLSTLCYDNKLSRHGFIIASGTRLWMNDLISYNHRSVIMNTKRQMCLMSKKSFPTEEQISKNLVTMC